MSGLDELHIGQAGVHRQLRFYKIDCQLFILRVGGDVSRGMTYPPDAPVISASRPWSSLSDMMR